MPEPKVLVPDAGPVYTEIGRPISNVIVYGDLVLLSGQAPVDESFTLVSPDFREQAHQVFRNLGHNLRAAGCGYADVLKVTSLLARPEEDIAAYNEIYREYFAPPWPVRTTYGVNLLWGFRLELDVWARRA